MRPCFLSELSKHFLVTLGMMIEHHNIKMLCYAYVMLNNDMGMQIYDDVSV